MEGKICSFIRLSPSSGWSADRGKGSSPGCPAHPESGYLRPGARVSSFRSLTAQVPRCKKPSLPKGTETLPCPRGAEQGTKPQHQGDTMPSISQSSHSETPRDLGLLCPLVWGSVSKLLLLPGEPVAKANEAGSPKDDIGLSKLPRRRNCACQRPRTGETFERGSLSSEGGQSGTRWDRGTAEEVTHHWLTLYP